MMIQILQMEFWEEGATQHTNLLLPEYPVSPPYLAPGTEPASEVLGGTEPLIIFTP